MVVICLERRFPYSVTNASSEDLRLSYAWSHNDEGLIGDVEAAAAAAAVGSTDGCAAAWALILELLGDNDVFEDVGTTVVAVVGAVCDGSVNACDLRRTTKAELSCPTRLFLSLLLLLLLLLPKMIFRRRLTGIATSSYV